MQTTEKDSRFSLSTKMKAPYGLINAPKEHHARLRRGLAAVFTTSALIQQEVIVQSHVDELIATFSRACDRADNGTAVVDMGAWGNYFAFDAIGSLTFGKPFGVLKSGGVENFEWARALREVVTMGTYEQAASRLVGLNSVLQPWIVWLCKAFQSTLLLNGTHFAVLRWLTLSIAVADKSIYASRFQTYGRTIKAIVDRLALGVKEDHKDFVHHILKNNENRNLLSEDEIRLNLTGFIIAGGETVGLTLTLWAYCMGTHREEYFKLRDLIRGTFATAEDIRWTALKDMSYLDAVLRESWRMPIFSTVQRLRVIPPGGMPVDGHELPGGTVVAVAEYAAMHSPDNFKDPYVFRPDRWLNTNPETMDNLGLSREYPF